MKEYKGRIEEEIEGINANPIPYTVVGGGVNAGCRRVPEGFNQMSKSVQNEILAKLDHPLRVQRDLYQR